MAYIALKVFDAPGGGKRRPGDVVPEASTWRDPQPWVNKNWVKWVADDEIVDGRWLHYEAYAGGRASAPVTFSARAHASAKQAHASAKQAVTQEIAAPLSQEAAVESAVPGLTKDELSAMTKHDLLELAEQRGVVVKAAQPKAEVIQAILDAG
jgi:hypothetical protein